MDGLAGATRSGVFYCVGSGGRVSEPIADALGLESEILAGR
jgi:hypothetical protein